MLFLFMHSRLYRSSMNALCANSCPISSKSDYPAELRHVDFQNGGDGVIGFWIDDITHSRRFKCICKRILHEISNVRPEILLLPVSNKKLSYRRDSAGRWSLRHSMSLKVIYLGINQKPVYDFLLVNSINVILSRSRKCNPGTRKTG